MPDYSYLCATGFYNPVAYVSMSFLCLSASVNVTDGFAKPVRLGNAHHELAAQASKAVNISLTLRNWLIGCYIVEYEMSGQDRAEYGEKLLARLAVELGKLSISRSAYSVLRKAGRRLGLVELLVVSVELPAFGHLPPKFRDRILAEAQPV